MSRKPRNPLTQPALPFSQQPLTHQPPIDTGLLGDLASNSQPTLANTNGGTVANDDDSEFPDDGTPAAERPNGLPTVPEVDTPPGSTRPKRPSEVFYLVTGTTKDGSCVDVLGKYPTGGQARKALGIMGMAVQRAYGTVQVLQCRDRTAA